MRNRDEVLQEFGLAPQVAGIPEQMMAERIRELEAQLAEMRDRLLTVEEMAERAEWKGYDLHADDVLAALNMKNI